LKFWNPWKPVENAHAGGDSAPIDEKKATCPFSKPTAPNPTLESSAVSSEVDSSSADLKKTE